VSTPVTERKGGVVNNQDQTEDWWLKASGSWETWVLIEAANDGAARVRFISDTREEFGELNFTSFERAIDALRRNEFRRYLSEDKRRQDIFHPPLQPFHRVVRPNLLYSIFWTDTPVSETSVLQKISAMLKKYEPGFELEGAFVPGVRGRADPNFSVTRAERLRLLAARKLYSPKEALLSRAEAFAFMEDQFPDGPEADPRINWRVTARHGDYYIHIMALNQDLSRFACCLQSASDVEEGLESEGRHPRRRYETGTLGELDYVLDDLYANFKREDEERRQQDRIDKAVAEERARWVKRLADEEAERQQEKTKRRQIGYLVAFAAAVFAVGYVINAINNHFHGVPGDVVWTVLGSGIFALIGASLYLWALVWTLLKFGLVEDKTSPRTMKIIMASAGIVFFALLAALAYAAFKGLI
jgi:hypothetical protein